MSTKSKNSTNSGKSSNESNAEQEKLSLKFSKTSNSNINSTVIPNNEEYLARLCHLKKWPHFQGYGFNLHAERSKMGQHIGKVDNESPADLAGLKEGDRIIEVNNVNISNENHQQVVKRIRNGLEIAGIEYSDQVILLVVDSKADEYYKKINVVPKNDMENIIRLVTPDRQPSKSNENDSENNEINRAGLKKENVSKNFSTELKNQSSNFPIPLHKDEHIEKDRKNSNSSSVSDKAESKIKTSQELNNSISSNSNTSNNASISKEHISINNEDRKSASNETQKEKKTNNMSHKDNSSLDSFRQTNVIFILILGSILGNNLN